ncbi:MAG: (2Fe-2S)-binding protein [bacterium]|nr:(2Fe-2S)-binding protein [bacterium]
MRTITVTINVNGVPVTRTAPGHYTLLRWLRDEASVFDVKYGCGEGVCGTCTVLLDGTVVSSCSVLAAQVDGSTVVTLSGVGATGFTELQEAFVEHGAAQCGFCTPGMILTASELLARGERLEASGVRHALHGNLCRCTGYQSIVDAVLSVSESVHSG